MTQISDTPDPSHLAGRARPALFMRGDAETPLSLRIAAALAVLAALALLAWRLPSQSGGAALAFSLLVGAAFGIVLQRARFCFFCNLRDFVDDGEPRGVLSILAALAFGVIGYAAIFGAWLPIPLPGRLPPDAHIGPVSAVLPLAAFVFGVGMTVSGSCLSAHLYRLGEGSPTAPFALFGSLLGFGAGFLTWNPLYLASISESTVVWLPHWTGYAGFVAVSLAVLGGLALAVLWGAKPAAPRIKVHASPLHGALASVFVERWPPILGGILIAIIATLAYLRVAPLGVTAELGSVARTGMEASGLMPQTLYGLDTFRGCATAVKTALLSENGSFVIGLIAGSFASALIAGQFTPRRPTAGQIVRGLTGGLLMGWAAMLALGCTVGVLLSGIHAGAGSGWVFLLFCTAGVLVSLKAGRAIARWV